MNEFSIERGESWLGKGVLAETLSADVPNKSLAGIEFDAPDTVHGTAGGVRLRWVKNGASTITMANQMVKYVTTAALDYGRYAAVNDVAGGPAWPIDDIYPVGYVIPAYDLFTIVVKGPCNIKTGATAIDLEAGEAVVSDGSGLLGADPAAAAQFVVGVIDQGTEAESTAVLVHVGQDKAPAEAAG